MAVFPPSEVREALARAARNLPESSDFRLVGQEKIHLTLKFLGDITPGDLDRVRWALERLGGRHESFEISTSGFGAFPSEKRARILWAGIEDGATLLRTVAEDVEELLERAGFERESKPYIPHLTLGRAKTRRAKLGGSGNPVPELRFTVPGVGLVRSVPGKHRVAYQILETYPFEKSPQTQPQDHADQRETGSKAGRAKG